MKFFIVADYTVCTDIEHADSFLQCFFELAPNTFHYFAAPAEAAARLHRVLADGGRLYLLERNKANSALTRLWGWLHRHWIRDNVEFYSLDELHRCLSGAGFEPVTVAHTVTRLLWKNKLYTSIALLEGSKGHTS